MEELMKLVIYDQSVIDKLIRKRKGEVKLGEKVQTLFNGSEENFTDTLKSSDCRYVLIGLPEDIGVRANGGRGGTNSAWDPVLFTLLNTQSNEFLRGNELLVLGKVDFTDAMEVAKGFDFHKKEDIQSAREIVSNIDAVVELIIRRIIEAGKEPIIVGGGHNNAYPCIKGAANALFAAKKIPTSSINVINCDAHSDFRPMEGRHSGNAFSYAFHENILNRYSVISLHESYNTQTVLEELHKNKNRIEYTTFEDIYIREKISFEAAMQKCIEFTSDSYTGLEIDLDAIQDIPSSARTSSGISTIEARRFVYKAATSCKIAYFHIAEAAPVLSLLQTDLKTGKLVSYLITDYIKARNEVMR